jgi:hypothetical protein
VENYLADCSLDMRTLFYGLVACEDLCIAEPSYFDRILNGVLYPTHETAFVQESSS